MIHSNGRYFEDYLCICTFFFWSLICTWMLFLLLKVLVNLSRGLCFFADSMSLKWFRATVFGLRIVSETRDCYYVCLCWFCHFVPNKMYSVLFGCPTFGCLWELESHCREARFSERFRWIHLPPRWNETSVSFGILGGLPNIICKSFCKFFSPLQVPENNNDPDDG